jgi:hypothetical protein
MSQRLQQVDAETGDDGGDQREHRVRRQLHDPVDDDHDGVIDAIEEQQHRFTAVPCNQAEGRAEDDAEDDQRQQLPRSPQRGTGWSGSCSAVSRTTLGASSAS